jgi:hypothetical protein
MSEDPRDTEQLRLLVVFHYVYIGFQAAGLAFLGLHYLLMRSVFGLIEKVPKEVPKVEAKIETAPLPGEIRLPPSEVVQPPEMRVDTEELFSEFSDLFLILHMIGAIFLVACMVLNFLATRLINQRKGRTFSMVVAGLNCLSFPFGTALGVFTLVVLARQTVINSYQKNLGSK